MKARNGGTGMSDNQVKAFVDRYIPGYVFFGSGVQQGGDGVSTFRCMHPHQLILVTTQDEPTLDNARSSAGRRRESQCNSIVNVLTPLSVSWLLARARPDALP